MATGASHWHEGLSSRQKLLVMVELGIPEQRTSNGRLDRRSATVSGWSVFREPTTIHPPTTLRLHKRDSRGRLVQVVSITENGVTR